MPIRTSKTEHEYPYGHRRGVGERFDVDANDVKVLLLLGRIEPAPGEHGFVETTTDQNNRVDAGFVPAPANYGTRQMTASRARRANGRAA